MISLHLFKHQNILATDARRLSQTNRVSCPEMALFRNLWDFWFEVPRYALAQFLDLTHPQSCGLSNSANERNCPWSREKFLVSGSETR